MVVMTQKHIINHEYVIRVTEDIQYCTLVKLIRGLRKLSIPVWKCDTLGNHFSRSSTTTFDGDHNLFKVMICLTEKFLRFIFYLPWRCYSNARFFSYFFLYGVLYIFRSVSALLFKFYFKFFLSEWIKCSGIVNFKKPILLYWKYVRRIC